MTEGLRVMPTTATIDSPLELVELLERRRSIRCLDDGPFPSEVAAQLADAVRLTPSAYNTPPWHVVIIHREKQPFWSMIETCFRQGLEGERLDRYLDRLEGFRSGVGVALVFEDRAVFPVLKEAWSLTDAQAHAFVQQGLGMVQLSLWLTMTQVDLVTSLQHWEWLIEDHVAEFTGLPRDRYQLMAEMPFGYAAEHPRPVERIPVERVVTFDPVPGNRR